MSKSVKGTSKRVLLTICDGMGFSENTIKNAVRDAKTPNLDRFLNEYPHTTITPGGTLVGLPKGVAGNSEVGHMNLGAGRPVRQDLVRINEAVENNSVKDLEKFKELIEKAKAGSKRIHLMGLFSDGGVHSHINHLKHIIEQLNTHDDLSIYLHAFMDGRDTPQKNGINYLSEVSHFPNFHFASMQGRSIGMDRDRRWDKIERAYKMMTGSGDITSQSPLEYIEAQYEDGIYDEFITPVLFNVDYKINSDDVVFFINFRPDRAKQISEAFCSEKFEHFSNNIRPAYFLCMSPYIDEEFPHVPILFQREKVKGTLSEYLSKSGKKHLKIAETEKYAHVTYFFNGGEEKPFEGEERVLVNSPKDVETYDLKPQMSAYEVLEKLSDKLKDDSFSVYIVNFANPDMVGHTGNYKATVEAMEHIDKCLGELEKVCKDEDITMLITADHGNCDQMTHPDGSPHTSHSSADVPFILVNNKVEKEDIQIEENDRALKDVAPTILNLLGLEIPNDFSGRPVFK